MEVWIESTVALGLFSFGLLLWYYWIQIEDFDVDIRNSETIITQRVWGLFSNKEDKNQSESHKIQGTEKDDKNIKEEKPKEVSNKKENLDEFQVNKNLEKNKKVKDIETSEIKNEKTPGKDNELNKTEFSEDKEEIKPSITDTGKASKDNIPIKDSIDKMSKKDIIQEDPKTEKMSKEESGKLNETLQDHLKDKGNESEKIKDELPKISDLKLEEQKENDFTGNKSDQSKGEKRSLLERPSKLSKIKEELASSLQLMQKKESIDLKDKTSENNSKGSLIKNTDELLKLKEPAAVLEKTPIPQSLEEAKILETKPETEAIETKKDDKVKNLQSEEKLPKKESMIGTFEENNNTLETKTESIVIEIKVDDVKNFQGEEKDLLKTDVGKIEDTATMSPIDNIFNGTRKQISFEKLSRASKKESLEEKSQVEGGSKMKIERSKIIEENEDTEKASIKRSGTGKLLDGRESLDQTIKKKLEATSKSTKPLCCSSSHSLFEENEMYTLSSVQVSSNLPIGQKKPSHFKTHDPIQNKFNHKDVKASEIQERSSLRQYVTKDSLDRSKFETNKQIEIVQCWPSNFSFSSFDGVNMEEPSLSNIKSTKFSKKNDEIPIVKPEYNKSNNEQNIRRNSLQKSVIEDQSKQNLKKLSKICRPGLYCPSSQSIFKESNFERDSLNLVNRSFAPSEEIRKPSLGISYPKRKDKYDNKRSTTSILEEMHWKLIKDSHQQNSKSSFQRKDLKTPALDILTHDKGEIIGLEEDKQIIYPNLRSHEQFSFSRRKDSCKESDNRKCSCRPFTQSQEEFLLSKRKALGSETKELYRNNSKKGEIIRDTCRPFTRSQEEFLLSKRRILVTQPKALHRNGEKDEINNSGPNTSSQEAVLLSKREFFENEPKEFDRNSKKSVITKSQEAFLISKRGLVESKPKELDGENQMEENDRIKDFCRQFLKNHDDILLSKKKSHESEDKVLEEKRQEE